MAREWGIVVVKAVEWEEGLNKHSFLPF
jgi:hypothetical protein